MEKLEIYKNQEEIDKHLERSPVVCEAIQLLLNKVNSNGATLSPKALLKFVEFYVSGSVPIGFRRYTEFDGAKEITELLKNIAIDSVEEKPSIMGLKLSREKMLELIEIDPQDVNELSTLISSLSHEDVDLFKHIEFDTLGTTASLEPEYIKKINDRFTIFTASKKQIEVTKTLLKLTEALKEYGQVCTNFHIPEHIDGIKYFNKMYVLDEQAIRRYL